MGNLLNMSGGSLLVKGLPYDYEVEYLESTGTQWIDTEYRFSSDIITVDSKFERTRGQYFFIGNYGDSAENRFEILRERADLKILGRPNNLTISNSANEINTLVVSFNSGELSAVYKGKTVSLSGNNSLKTNTNTIYIGKRHDGAPYQPISIYRIWYLKIYDNNILTRDMIPVCKCTTGYLYDKVSGQLFGNQGTGNFILGPDKTN